jgi:hypothetical protein
MLESPPEIIVSYIPPVPAGMKLYGGGAREFIVDLGKPPP